MKLTCSMNNKQKSKKEKQSKFAGELIDMSKVNTSKSLLQIFSQLNICKSPPKTFKKQQNQYEHQTPTIIPQYAVTPTTTYSPTTLFPQFPSLSPSIYHSYILPYSFAQYIHAQCINRLAQICSSSTSLTNPQVDHEDRSLFIVKVIERYFYDMEYTHEVGCVLGQVGGLEEGRWEVVVELVERFPEVMKTRSFRIDKQLKERRSFIISYAIESLSLHLGYIYTQLKSLTVQQKSTSNNKNNNKWPLLITKLFSSLLFQHLPPHLTPCLTQLYLTQTPFHNLYQIIYPYGNFVKLLVSLFHYCHFMKKPKNEEEYYLLCSSPYMEIVEWPIVISNAQGFDLPIPKHGNKKEKIMIKVEKKNFGEMIKEAEILE